MDILKCAIVTGCIFIAQPPPIDLDPSLPRPDIFYSPRNFYAKEKPVMCMTIDDKLTEVFGTSDIINKCSAGHQCRIEAYYNQAERSEAEWTRAREICQPQLPLPPIS